MALPCFVQLNFMYLEALSVCSPATFNSESLNFYIFFHIGQNLHSYLHNRNSRFTETKKTLSQLIYVWFKFTIKMFKCFQMKIKRANKKIMCYLFYFKALFYYFNLNIFNIVTFLRKILSVQWWQEKHLICSLQIPWYLE